MRARVVALSLRAAPAGGVELRLRASQPEQRPPRKHRRRSCVGSCFWFVWQLCLLGATTLGSVLIYDLSVQYGRQPLQRELTIQTARDHLLLLTSERKFLLPWTNLLATSSLTLLRVLASSQRPPSLPLGMTCTAPSPERMSKQ